VSSLRFKKAPPRPEHIPSDIWESEWIGLSVGLVPIFPRTIGYLGAGNARIFDKATKTYRDPTESDAMNHITNLLSDPMWISREALIHSCTCAIPPRPTILKWLEEKGQATRHYFAVTDDVAIYLP
jgi:hypothetical protein